MRRSTRPMFPLRSRLIRARDTNLPTLVVLLLAAALLFVPGFSAETLAAPVAASVTVQNLPTSNAVTGVACPSSTQCYVVDNYAMWPDTEYYTGTVTPITFAPDGTLTAGETPLPQRPVHVEEEVLSGTLNAIACPSATSCYAVGRYTVASMSVGDYQAGAVVAFTSSEGALSGGDVHYIDGTSGLQAIACPTTTTCYGVGLATDGATGIVVQIDVDGDSVSPGNWRYVTNAHELTGIACPNATTCYIVGNQTYRRDNQDVFNGEVGSFNTADMANATTDPVTTVHDVDGTYSMTGIACPNTTSCYASGYHATNGNLDGGTLTAFSVNGSSITANSTQKIDGTDKFEGISCLDASTCYAVGQVYTDSTNTSGVLAQFALLNSPAEQVIGTTDLGAISCTSGACYAVGTSESESRTNWMVTISQASLIGTTTTVKSSANTSTYGQEVTLTATVVPGIGNAPSGTVQFAVDGKDSGSPVTLSQGNGQSQAALTLSNLGAGDHQITATYSGDGYHSGSASEKLALTVGQASLTITAPSPTMARGASTLPDLSAVIYSGFVNNEDASALGGTLSCSLTDSSQQPVTLSSSLPAGSYTITCSGQTATNYTLHYKTGTLTVTTGGQTISFSKPADVTYGAIPVTVTASASSSLPVSFSSKTASICTVSGSSVTIVGAGTCTIVAHQSGNANYQAAPDVSQSFTVNKAPLTITAEDQAMIYGASFPSFTVSYTGFVNGDTASAVTGLTCGALDSNDHPVSSSTPVGRYTITCAGASAVNYTISYKTGTLTITQATQSITFPALADVTYGVKPIMLTATASSKLPLSYTASGPCGISGATLMVTGTGICAVTAHQSGNADYSAATDVSRSFAVNKAMLTITADNKSVAFGAAIPALTYTPSGFGNGDTSTALSGAPSLSTTATTGSARNSYPITISQGTLAATNYTFKFVNGTLTINQASQTISFSAPPDVTYGATPVTLTASASSSLPVSFSTKTASICTVSGSSVTITGAGTCTIVAHQSGNANYQAAQDVSKSFTVNKAPLTITAKDQTMIYGGTVPSFTAGEQGFVNGDTDSVVTGLACGALDGQSKAVTSSTPVGKYTINCSGATASNYTISYKSGTLTIKPAPLTITADDQTMIVGGSPTKLTWSGQGWVNGDSAGSLTTQPTCTTTATGSSSVGTYPITCTGAIDANYTMSYQGGTLTVTYGASIANDPITVTHGYWAIVQIEVLDAQGNNQSSRSLKATAENLSPAGQSWDGKHGNFIHQFQFGPALGSHGHGTPSGGYRLMINTHNLAPGNYTLWYQITDDPMMHSLTITVK